LLKRLFKATSLKCGECKTADFNCVL